MSGENLALNLRQLDSARVLTNYTWRKFESLKNVVDGDPLSGWPPIELDIVNTRENNPFFAVVLVVDLGAPFGVDRIAFSAVEGLEFRFIEGFQVFIQDGKEPVAFPKGRGTGTGSCAIGKLVAEVEQTEGSAAHIEMPPRLVRYVALSDTISLPSARLWQLGEVEVPGQGVCLLSHLYIRDHRLWRAGRFGGHDPGMRWTIPAVPCRFARGAARRPIRISTSALRA